MTQHIGKINGSSLSDSTSFYAINMFKFSRTFVDKTRKFEMAHHIEEQMQYTMKYYSFKGLILENFILGSFQSPEITVSSTRIFLNEPVEVIFTVTRNGYGVDNFLICLSIPRLVEHRFGTTNTSGQVSFNFTAPTTGEISIEAEGVVLPITIQIFD